MHRKPISAVLLLISILGDPPFRQPEPNPYGETPNQETNDITKEFEMAGARPHTWNKSKATMFSMHARVFKDGTARNDPARQTELQHEQLLGQANGNQELDHDRVNSTQQQPRHQQHEPHHLQQQLHEHHLQQQLHEPHHIQQQHQQLPQAQGDMDRILNTPYQRSQRNVRHVHQYEQSNNGGENNLRQYEQQPIPQNTNQPFQYHQQKQQPYQIHHNNIREYQPHNYPLPPHNGQYQPYCPVDQNPGRTDQTNLLNNTQETHRQQNFQNHAQPNLPHYSQPYHPNNQHHNPIDPTHPLNNQQNHRNTHNRFDPDLPPNHDQPHYHDNHRHNPLGPLNNVQQNSHQDNLRGNAAAHPNQPHGRYVYDVDYLRWWHAQMYPSHSPSQPNPRDEL